MEIKKRYCPSCGDKTNDGKCDICGRATKPISMRVHEKELDLVEDDVATDNREQFSGDYGYQEAKHHHARDEQRPTLQMKAGEHPYYEHGSKRSSDLLERIPSFVTKLAPFLVAFVIAMISFGIGFFNDSEDSDEINYEPTVVQGNFFSHVTRERSVSDLSCSLTQKDGIEYVMMENNSSDYISADLMNGDFALKYLTLIPPYTSVYAEPYELGEGGCQVKNATAYEVDFFNPEISYHLTQTEDAFRYDLEEPVEEEQIQNMLIHTLAGQAQNYVDNDNITIYIKGEIAYDVFIYTDSAVHVDVSTYPGFDSVDSFSFDLT